MGGGKHNLTVYTLDKFQNETQRNQEARWSRIQDRSSTQIELFGGNGA